ncbi:hypothetical protein GEMRC1_000697 [Eukaryota sp. GEM-RC1]
MSDFGTSRVLSETTPLKVNQLTFTFKYLAPEALSNRKSLKLDIYSLGMILYELFCNELVLGVQMCALQLIFPARIDQCIVDLVSSCCHVDMKERPKLKDIYESLNKLSEEFPKDCKSIEDELNSHVNDRSSAGFENLIKQNSELYSRVLSLQSELSEKIRELSQCQEFSENF